VFSIGKPALLLPDSKGKTMWLYFVTFALVISTILSGCANSTGDSSPNGSPATVQEAVGGVEAVEQTAAQEWISAIANLDGNNILKYTCLEQRPNIQEITAWTATLPVLGSILSRQDVKVQGDVSDIGFETTVKTDLYAEIHASGELRMAVSAMADAQMVDERWYMVFENDTWRWCGSLDGTLSLPLPVHMLQTVQAVEAQPSQSTVEDSNVGTIISTAEELERYVIGLWLDEAFANSAQVDSIKIGIAFFPDGRIVDLDAETGTYRALDSRTIEVTTKDWTERLNFEIINSSTAAISVSRSPSEQTIAKRVVANTSTGDFSQDILGEWEQLGLMEGQRGGVDIQWSFLSDANGSIYGEGVSIAYAVNTDKIPFNYVIENNTLIGLGTPIEIYSLGDFIVLSYGNGYGSYGQFLQRIGSRPTTTTHKIPTQEVNQSIVGVWKLRNQEPVVLLIFLSNGLAAFSEGFSPYNLDSSGNLTLRIRGGEVTFRARMPNHDLLEMSIDAEVLIAERIQTPQKLLTGNIQEDILGTWTTNVSGEVIQMQFLPSDTIVFSESYIRDETDIRTSTGNYAWISDTHLRAEIQGQTLEFDVSFVDGLLILGMEDNQTLGLLWSEE
jgi:hypothetical protein